MLTFIFTEGRLEQIQGIINPKLGRNKQSVKELEVSTMISIKQPEMSNVNVGLTTTIQSNKRTRRLTTILAKECQFSKESGNT